MKKFLSIFAIVALALGFTACEPTVEPQPEAQKPTLSVDKSEILANGADKATFTATVDGVENADIQIISLKDNSILSGNTFTTTEPGKYQFKAIYGQESSDVVEVTAKEVEKIITLEADKSEIVADDTDTVTFIVKVDGEVVTDNYEITNLNYNIKVEGNTFTSDVTGEFKFQAMYEGKWLSNEVAVVANAVPAPEVKELRLSVSPNRIKADGTEEAIFTVTFGQEDVTSEAEIYNVNTSEVLSGNKFKTSEVGTHSFRARYQDKVTGESTNVDAYDPNWEGKYEPGMLYNENGVKGVIFAIKEHPASGTMFCYVMSMDEEDLAWSNEQVDLRCASSAWGAWITEDIFHPSRDNRNIDDYPAFKWCVEHGEGWFLPSQQEMQWMWDAVSGGTLKFDSPSVAHYNKLLSENGGEPFVETYYWSSTGLDKTSAVAVAFMEDSVVCLESTRDKAYSVRAAYRFAIN
ncbi:MAG: hypothetical protein J6U95_01280 [Alistipes sp.]|nr:hypothetical protein [Alistipes sp.]